VASKETTTSDPGWKNTRDWIQLLVVVFVALSGTYQFVFKDIIKPSREPTALELATSLENIAEQDGMLLIRVRITAINQTSRRIYVPAFWFNVRAVKLSSAPSPGAADEKLTKTEPDGLVVAYGRIDSRQPVAHQRIVPGGLSWWEPKDKTHNEAVFTVPKGEFDYLEMRVFYLHTRFGDVLLDPEWIMDGEGEWNADFKLKPGLFGERDPFEWQEETGSGLNWAVTTLPLWDKEQGR